MVKKSSEVIFQGPMHGSSYFMDHKHNSVPKDGSSETTHHVHDMYSATFKRKPNVGVGHGLPKHSSL